MNAETWFREKLRALENDPDYLTEEVLIDVTEQLYIRMREAGMKPADLAKRLGVSRAFISQLFNGKPNMTMRTLVGVAHALDQRIQISVRPRSAFQLAAQYTRFTSPPIKRSFNPDEMHKAA